jgi:hypothetical protein
MRALIIAVALFGLVTTTVAPAFALNPQPLPPRVAPTTVHIAH